jgi:hypothetical protein
VEPKREYATARPTSVGAIDWERPPAVIPKTVDFELPNDWLKTPKISRTVIASPSRGASAAMVPRLPMPR